MRYARCVGCYEVVGWVGLVVNLVLSGLKIFVGFVAGSHALVADGIYSAKDVVTSILIIIGLQFSRKPIDREHPFGHGKVEFLISLVISLLLMGVVGILFVYAAGSLIEGTHQAPHIIALVVALLSVAVNLFMSRYTGCVAAEINSPVVSILAQHHHSDATSSMAVAVGIVGAHYLGMPWLDTVVAMGETIDLFYLGTRVFWDAFQGLMDSSAPTFVVEAIESESMAITGVKGIEMLRTRRVGQEIWIDMVINVDPDLSVAEAKRISRRVETRLARNIPHVGDISVHFKSPYWDVPEFETIRKVIVQTLDAVAGMDHPSAAPPLLTEKGREIVQDEALDEENLDYSGKPLSTP